MSNTIRALASQLDVLQRDHDEDLVALLLIEDRVTALEAAYARDHPHCDQGHLLDQHGECRLCNPPPDQDPDANANARDREREPDRWPR